MFWTNRKGLTRAALLLLSPVILPAQGPPINTATAFVNGLEGAAFRSFVFSVRRSGLARDGRDIADPQDREVSIHGVPLMLPYEIVKNRLVAAAVFPILRKEMRLTRDGRRRTLSTSGLGDAFVNSKLLLVQRDGPGRTTRFAATGRIKLPTGKDDETDDQGDLLPPPLQLGSGSVDYTVGGVLTHVRKRVGFNADASYHFRTEARGFAFGDSVTYNLSLGYRFAPRVYKVYPAKNHLNAYIELNGQSSQKNRARGVETPDSGGTLIYLSPGIQIIPGNFIIEASLRLPVVQSLNGAQLKFRPGFTLGMRWLLF
ncbi:MAG: transporter [Acidobacteria bacterium]|nr:transporter [Acidobacteriota bacterium]